MRDQPKLSAGRLTPEFPRCGSHMGAASKDSFKNHRALTPEAAQCLQHVALNALSLFFTDTQD